MPPRASRGCCRRMRTDAPTTEPSILVDHPTALVDAAISIRLLEFLPRRPVTISAVQTFPSSTRYRAEATFISDDEGVVDVSKRAPVEGTYDSVSPMGLFWSAERLPGEAHRPAEDCIMWPRSVDLEASGPWGAHADLKLERRVAGPGVTRQVVRAEGVVGTLFLPSAIGPHPTVLVLSGGGGGVDE